MQRRNVYKVAADAPAWMMKALIGGREAFVEARAAAAKALAYVHMNLDWNLEAAAEVLREAEQHAPRDATIKNTQAILLTYQLRSEEALAARRAAIAIDPLNVIILGNLSADYRSLGRLDEAEAVIRKAIDLQPNSAQSHYLRSRILIARGQADAALAEARLEPAPIYLRFGVALAQAARHDRPAADAALEELIANHAQDNPFRIAQTYALRGEAEKMLEWLERAQAEHDPRVINTTSDDLLVPYHSDPRFRAFCERIGLKPPDATLTRAR